MRLLGKLAIVTGATSGIGEATARALAKEFKPLTDMRASEQYRTQVAANLLQRFHAEVSHPDRPASVWSHVS